MGKRILNLYANDEDINLCKAKGINISALFRAFIGVELYSRDLEPSDKNELIEQLKVKLAKFKLELENKTIELEKIKAEAEKTKKDKKDNPLGLRGVKFKI